MILAVDHLAWNTTNTLPSIDFFITQKYQVEFEEQQIRNAPEKKTWLHEFYPHHDLIFLKKTPKISIEITRHGSQVFKNTGTYTLNNKQMVVATSKLTEEQIFWNKALGFREHPEQKLFTFTSPVMRTAFSIKIVQRQTPLDTLPMLDDEGYTCIAFISSNIRKDIQKISDYTPYAISEIFSLTVNNIPLEIALVRSPGAAIIELIQMHKS